MLERTLSSLQLFRWMQYGFGFLFLFTLSSFLWLRALSLSPFPALASQEISLSLPLSYDHIFGKALSLSPPKVQPFSVNLSQEMQIYVSVPRPQSANKEPLVLIRKGSSDRHYCSAKEKVYLQISEGGFIFSKEPSAHWIILTPTSSQEVRVQLYLSQSATPDLFTLPLHELKAEKKISSNSPFFSLVQALWAGPKLSFESNEMGRDLSEKKHKIVFPSSCNSCEIKEGSCLVWKTERWEEVCPGDQVDNFPLVRVKGVSSKELEWEGWDKEIYYSFVTPAQKPVPMSCRPEELFQNARLHNRHQIMCKVEKQDFLLNEGTWLFRSKERWKRCSGLSSLPLDGEGYLFFEKILEKGPALFIKGLLLNGPRTQMISLEVPIKSKQAREVVITPVSVPKDPTSSIKEVVSHPKDLISESAKKIKGRKKR